LFSRGRKITAISIHRSLRRPDIELGIAGLIVAAIIASWPTGRALWHYWIDDHFLGGRGVLVAALALWLLYRARARLPAVPMQGQPWILPVLLACNVAALVFWKAGLLDLQTVMLPTLILVGLLTAFGPAVTRVVAVPVGLLYLAAPAWDDLLAPPLQALTLWIVKWLAPAIGVPASVSGSWILLPGDMRFNVALGCSGVGFLVEGLAIAALLGELEQASVGHRLRIFLSMIPVALVANWIRVLALVQIGFSTGMRHVLVTQYHLLFGYGIFIAVLLLFIWAATRGPMRSAPETTESRLAAPSRVPREYFAALIVLAIPPLLLGILALS
jgi:exosortase